MEGCKRLVHTVVFFFSSLSRRAVRTETDSKGRGKRKKVTTILAWYRMSFSGTNALVVVLLCCCQVPSTTRLLLRYVQLSRSPTNKPDCIIDVLYVDGVRADDGILVIASVSNVSNDSFLPTIKNT